MNIVLSVFAVIGFLSLCACGLVIAALVYDNWYWKHHDIRIHGNGQAQEDRAV